MAEVSLKVDGRDVTVPAGATVLTAARKLGIHIPTFCYHDSLSIAANCRMCLVETDKTRGLVPACHTQVSDGMSVQTDNERVREAQRAVLEFILVNHPVDCPICDQAGECELQDNYRDHDLKASRLNVSKVQKPKAKQLGPYMMYDGERCILCTRCVRFTREIAKSNDLTVANRGEHAEITTFPGRELDNPYSMCTADLCPVGALTTIPFRFRARVWWLESVSAVCNRCARGCAIRVDTRRNEVQRYVPRENPHVNEWWMCDAGRLSFRDELAERVVSAQVKDGDGRRDVSTKEAAEQAIARLNELRAGEVRFGVLLSPNLSNEELSNALRLVAEGLPGARVYLGGRADGDDEDALLIRNDKNANRFGAREIASALDIELADQAALEGDVQAGAFGALVTFGAEHVLGDGAMAALAELDFHLAIAAQSSPLVASADVVLPACSFLEQDGSFTNFEGRVQAFAAALTTSKSVHPVWKIAARLAAGLGVELPRGSAGEVFADLAARVPYFQGLALAELGELGVSPQSAQGEGE